MNPQPTTTFHRFLELPIELRLMVFEKYFEAAKPYLKFLSTGRITVHGFPSLNIEATCKLLRLEAKLARDKVLPTYLTTDGNQYALERSLWVPYQTLNNQLLQQAWYPWLLQRTTIIEITASHFKTWSTRGNPIVVRDLLHGHLPNLKLLRFLNFEKIRETKPKIYEAISEYFATQVMAVSRTENFQKLETQECETRWHKLYNLLAYFDCETTLSISVRRQAGNFIIVSACVLKINPANTTQETCLTPCNIKVGTDRDTILFYRCELSTEFLTSFESGKPVMKEYATAALCGMTLREFKVVHPTFDSDFWSRVVRNARPVEGVKWWASNLSDEKAWEHFEMIKSTSDKK